MPESGSRGKCKLILDFRFKNLEFGIVVANIYHNNRRG